MSKSLVALAALSALVLAAPAMAEDVSANAKSSYESTSNGGYTAKQSTEKTDANGTTDSVDASKKVSVDSKGNTTATVETKETVDPKGLGNATTTKTTDKASMKDGKMHHTHVKKVNGTTVEKTDDNGAMQ